VRGLGRGVGVEAALREETGLTPEELVAGWKSWAGLDHR
jgi:hypothetical protein